MIEQVELPDAMIFLEKLEGIDTLTTEEVAAETKWLFRTAKQFHLTVDSYTTENEYVEDPQIVADRLDKYRQYSGALLGLAVALYRRSRFLIYEGLTEESRSTDPTKKRKSLIQGDREQYSKGRNAALEGLVKTLGEQHEALVGRVYRTGSRSGTRSRQNYGD